MKDEVHCTCIVIYGGLSGAEIREIRFTTVSMEMLLSKVSMVLWGSRIRTGERQCGYDYQTDISSK